MSRFTGLLRQTSERLNLPQPEKSRILLEIASDLEDMYQVYLEQGLGEEEAVRKAEEKFDISGQALEQLVQIHESTFRKFLGKISEQAQTRWERALLTAVILFIAAFSGGKLLSTQILGQASNFIWPVLGISSVTLVLLVFQVYKLYIKKDHDIRRLRSGLPWLLAMGGLSILTGFFGLLFEMYSSVGMGAENIEMFLVYIVEWALRCSAMMIVSLLVAIAAGLIWFILMNKVRRIELAEAAWLLE